MKSHLRAWNVVWSLLLTAPITLAGGAALAEYGTPFVTAEDRQVIPFGKRFAPGEIVVSFGDRRLYHVRERGKAISYPIAVPRSQSRWSGVERISMKRINPSWVPTPEMRRENPRLPSYVPGAIP